jgi:phosphatidylserine/phosphatidylglycerophosphate/cardiolipin synthase-like enzyme
MGIKVTVYDNGDHTALIWLPDDVQPIENCRGFAIKRNHNGQEDYLHSFVGFSDDDKLDPANPWKWPLQRYMWWDYHVKPGDSVSYQIIPVTGAAANLQEATAMASAWTETLKVTGQCTANISTWFNKGIVASQWVSRELDQEAQGKNRQSALKEIIATEGDPLRNALAGLLKDEILQLLKDAAGEVYAALYELNDPELIAALTALGKSAHVILANGAFSKKEPDENAAARETLRKAGVEVFDRMVTSGHFAHNKFAVICDSVGRAKKVLSGSTNWTSTGLCTQANNGLIIQDPAVAGRFLQQWHSLQQAGNVFPKDLVAAN